MTPSSPLDQLRDIHPPTDIGWWPIANTWWVLIAITIILVSASIFTFIRHRRKNVWRRTALIELNALSAHQKDSSNLELARQLSILIKRCLASTSNANRSATSASDRQLEEILKTSLSKNVLSHDLISILSYDLYKADCPEITQNDLASVELWIKGLRNA